MPLRIKTVSPDSLASDFNIKPGDQIISINDNFITDFIDLQFYSADEELDIQLQNTNGKYKIHIHNDWSRIFGIIPEAHNCTQCVNNCIFCFVDQIQPDFRDTLHIKDDDFRLSFTYGNFITLTNLTSYHMQRIFQQKLSPLYVSVHTTDPELHRSILRYSIEFNIYERLKQMIDHGIQLHTQIVVIPDWNDKANLKRTISDLNNLGTNILSIGIVPLGLTNWRKHLTPLRPVEIKEAKEIITSASGYPRTYCADELFILAEKEIPPEEYYDDYPQLENGIGMIRLLQENWKFNKQDFLAFINSFPEILVFITGVSAFQFINAISVEINRENPGKTRTVEVQNNTFGSTVTVAGLLTAKDIKEQVMIAQNEIIVFSSNLFNDDLFTLDNISLDELKQFYGNKLLLIDEEFNNWELA